VSAQPNVDGRFSGKLALVTGASRGIGAAIARRLDREGARVALVARDRRALEELASELRNQPLVLPADLSQHDAPIGLVERLLGSVARVDVLVNNAGAIAMGSSGELPLDEVDRLLALNVRAPLLLASKLAPHMSRAGGGVIVNLSSAVASRGMPYIAAYSATKGALDAMTRSLAAEWGPLVRVVSVNPGMVATDMTEPLLADAVANQFYVGSVPLRRMGAAEDVAKVVAFIASDEAAYVSAESLTLDGGWSKTGRLHPPG
jgi:NAD(P)-dependent dehydrogenase (short-subunit alcohol dehydrogenase family)